MRNIIITSDRTYREDLNNDRSQIQGHCFNADSQEAYMLTAGNQVLRFGDSDYQADLQAQIEDLQDKQICSFSYELELDALSLVYESGHILLLDPLDVIVEEVGLVEGGILAARWSPDGELLAVITGHGLLLLFNKAFEVLSESNAQAWPSNVVPSRKLPFREETESLQQASISWRGDGTFFASVTESTAAGSQAVLRIWERDECLIHAIGEDSPGLLGPVCWQPNGRHIYAAQELEGQQGVVLFERNGLSHGSFVTSSEQSQAGRISTLAWSPDSTLLAIQYEPEGESSTSARLEIWLRSNWRWYLKQKLQIDDCCSAPISWNDEGPNSFTVCNRHGGLRKVKLSHEHAVSALGTCAVIDGKILQITPLRHCIVPPPMSAATAAFTEAIQCLAFLDHMEAEVIACALLGGQLALLRANDKDLWDEAQEGNAEENEEGEIQLRPELLQLDEPDALTHVQIRCLAWAGAGRLLAAGSSYVGQDQLLQIDITSSLDASPVTARIAGKMHMDLPILNIASGLGDTATIQFETGRCQVYNQTHSLEEAEAFPQPCQWMSLIPTEGRNPVAVGLSEDGHLYFGSKLVADSVTSATVRHASNGKPAYLLYTTRDNFLHTKPVMELSGAIMQATEAPMQNGRAGYHRGLGEGRRDNHYTDMHAAMRGHGTTAPSGNILKARAVEQGSKIVAAPPDDIFVVLELPRGNLETIYPRSLVLPAVAAAVQDGDFSTAWQLATAHRVDLNLIVDYGWPAFLSRADDFVAQVSNDQDIVDLLSAVREDSVVADQGLYSGLPPASTSPPTAEIDSKGSKVALVNRALQGAMRSRDPELYIKPLLTSHATQGELEEALTLIKDAKEAQLAREASNGQASTSGLAQTEEISMGQGNLGKHRRKALQQPPSAEDALKHLLLTVDVEQLYRASLGMYELELAYMVVAHSQRDPGEYQLELQLFAEKPEGPLREFAINLHLQRISAAIKNLLAAGEAHFPQAVALARKEGKLRELLSLIGDEPEALDKRKQVLGEYGSWLSERHMREDAAVTFMAAGDLEAALQEYQEGNFWRMAMFIAGRLGYKKDKIQELADSFVSSLSASSRLAEAAAVATEYLHDADSAVSLLAQAREWREALRVAAMFERQDLVETTIAPQAADSASTIQEDLQETAERISKYDARLLEVREKRAAMAAVLEDGTQDQQEANEFDETASEGGSSIVSGLSMYTQASTGRASTAASSSQAASTIGGRMPQRKQKKNKKGPRIRQGSPQEEEALISHILSLAPTPQLCSEVGQLTEMLIFLGHEADARNLQALLSKVLVKQKAAADKAVQGQAPKADGSSANLPATSTKTVHWKWDVLRPIQQ